MKININKSHIRRKLIPFGYVLPACIVMFVFIMIPIIMSVYMSFFHIPSFKSDWQWVGFRNFLLAFSEMEFIYALLRTLGFGAFGVVTQLALGLFLALLVCKDRALNFYRYTFYVPSVVSAVTMGMLWSQMLDATKYGMLNSLLINLGIIDASAPIAWLATESITWIVVLAIGLIGAGGGMTFIVFTTAINDVPRNILEAAMIDGATSFKLNMKIVLPMIKPMITSWMVLSIIGSLKSFEFIYSLTAGGPNKTTQTLGILLFDGSNAVFGMGYTSAMGVLMSVIVLLMTAGYMWIDKKFINKTEETA